MVRAGMKREVLESLTPWVCASCYQCTVSCPAGIAITEIMYALKRLAGREGITPPDSDAIRFAKPVHRGGLHATAGRTSSGADEVHGVRHPIRMARQSARRPRA